jgi:DNA-binding cell septation regulator SpoVG
MRSSLAVSDIRFAAANLALQSKGLLGWVICTYGDLEIRCLQIRRTEDGRYAVGFPSRTDANGVMHPIVRPLDQGARDAIEAQVLGELRRRGRFQ